MPGMRRPAAAAKQRRPAAAAVRRTVQVKKFRFPCGRAVTVAAPRDATCPLVVYHFEGFLVGRAN
jgi:hypothetical protein